MKTVVFAYRTLGVRGLEALLRAGHDIARVFTHGPGPADQAGENFFASVAEFCRRNDIGLEEPDDASSKECIALVQKLGPDIVFNLGYELPIHQTIAAAPPGGTVNVQLSALPEFHGPLPHIRAILANKRKTGVTVHYYPPREGKVVALAREEEYLGKHETSVMLYDKLSEIAGEMLDEILPSLAEGKAETFEIELEDARGPAPIGGRINWKGSSWDAYNQIRALARPYSGAYSFFLGDKMTIWWAEPDDTGQALLDYREIEVDEETGRAFAKTSFGAIRLEEIEWRGQVLKGPDIVRALAPHWNQRFDGEEV